MDLALVDSRTAGALPPRSVTRLGRPVRVPAILAWMLLAIATVTALAYWDEERESTAALDEFAQEQLTLAESLTASLEERLRSFSGDATREPPGGLLAAIRSIERPQAVRVFVQRPGIAGLAASDGEMVRSRVLEAATSAGSFRLSREEAHALGLPARTAMAGTKAFDAGAQGRWAVFVVATARLERDRGMRARWRLVLGVLLASGLVLGFGGLAMRTQRKELELGHELEVTTIRNERDERLVRADKLATMGALATGIAHEVSTPLGVILGRAEQLLPKQTDERTKRAVEAIVQQTERIHAVIRGFLALARGGQPTLAHCDPTRLALAAVELVEHRFDKASVSLTTDIGTDAPKVLCDARLFEQVLVNLLLNACDACEEGGKVHLTVRAEHGRVAFEVLDDGIGIAAAAAERATEPFFTTKPEGKGTGLGLAIANEIVKHHSGSLALRPGPNGRGTSASVELPAAAGDDDHD